MSYEGGGDPSQTIVVGSHLDSVPEGPGMNGPPSLRAKKQIKTKAKGPLALR